MRRETPITRYIPLRVSIYFIPQASFLPTSWKHINRKKQSVENKKENREQYQNSSKLIVPFRSASNIRIIMRTVCGSNLLQSPLTSAFCNSGSLSWPLLSRSTALNSGHKASRSLASRGGAGVEGGRLAGGGRPCDEGGGPRRPKP